MTDRQSDRRADVENLRTEVVDNADQSMDKIRKLLFGSQMHEYDRRLDELTGRIDQRVDQQRDEQNARMSKLEEVLRAELQRMSNQLKQERELRSTGLEELADAGNELKCSLLPRIEALDERLSKDTMDLRCELRDQVSELLDTLHQRNRELADSLEREYARLQDEKTSRGEMAQLFSELALRLNRELDLPEP